MAHKDKRKVWVDVKGHERRVLKCQNKAAKKFLKVKLPGIENKRRARQTRPISALSAAPPATPPRRRRKRISPPRATLA